MSLLPKTVPGLDALPLDYRVMTFAILSACASAIVFGLGPALSGAGGAVLPSLGPGIQRQRWLNILAAAQMTIAIILLTGGGLMLQSFWKAAIPESGISYGSHIDGSA